MASFVNFFTKYYDVIFSGLVCLSSIGYTIFLIVKNRKRLKTSKTDGEKMDIVNEIKADVMGFISIAENLFSDIPKSGGSKLLYVLNEIKRVCSEKAIDFDSVYWTDFVDNIVAKTNEVLDQKELEAEKKIIIDRIKAQIPHFVSQASDLFASIPQAEAYMVEYVLKLVAVSCENESIDVYTAFDWRSHVESFFVKE